MQPYLYPYAGYFRLMALADTFVILDDVQFARRGRMHRCEVPDPRGGTAWLTLPIARQCRDVAIADVAFAENARAELDARLRRLRWLAGDGPLAGRVRAHLYGPLTTPCEFVADGLALVGEALELPARHLRSSSLDIDRALRGEARILAVAQALGARTYINSPGGRHLYDPVSFAEAGVELRFLAPYDGRFPFLLPALMTDHPEALREDIVERCTLLP
jgi:hypothetical protein